MRYTNLRTHSLTHSQKFRNAPTCTPPSEYIAVKCIRIRIGYCTIGLHHEWALYSHINCSQPGTWPGFSSPTHHHIWHQSSPTCMCCTPRTQSSTRIPPDRQDKTVLCVSCLYVCRYVLDDCCERVQTSEFVSVTVLSCRESNSHRRSGRDRDQTRFVVSGVAA